MKETNVTAETMDLNKARLDQLIWQAERSMQSWFRGATSPQKPAVKKMRS